MLCNSKFWLYEWSLQSFSQIKLWVQNRVFTGVVLIDNFQVFLKSLPNFHNENPAAFCLIFMAKIRQRFTSDVSQHAKHYSHHAFNVRVWQQGCLIFTVKIRQIFAFCVLWSIGRVLRLCIWHVSTCLYCDNLKPFNTSSILMRVAYMGKPTSLGDIDQDNHTAMIMHTIQHEYAPTEIALSAPILQGQELS